MSGAELIAAALGRLAGVVLEEAAAHPLLWVCVAGVIIGLMFWSWHMIERRGWHATACLAGSACCGALYLVIT